MITCSTCSPVRNVYVPIITLMTGIMYLPVPSMGEDDHWQYNTVNIIVYCQINTTFVTWFESQVAVMVIQAPFLLHTMLVSSTLSPQPGSLHTLNSSRRRGRNTNSFLHPIWSPLVDCWIWHKYDIEMYLLFSYFNLLRTPSWASLRWHGWLFHIRRIIWVISCVITPLLRENIIIWVVHKSSGLGWWKLFKF